MRLFCSSLLLVVAFHTSGQSTARKVYDVLQTNCANAYCHSSGSQAGGLDLEGSGGNINAKIQDVYDNLYDVNPSNAEAASKGHKLIYPGDPYRSYLFRKVNNGLSPDVVLDASEGSDMPIGGSMTDEDIELVRQWILYGSPLGGDVVNTALIDDFYQNGGIESVPNPPAPPANGFQVHFGPFFLEAGGEREHFLKYETNLPENVEVTEVSTTMGDYSHHFITYKYIDFNGNPTFGQSTPVGLRGIDNESFSVVATEQYTNALTLPDGTAFELWQDIVFDLNSHYINYDLNQPMKCEAYINFETQPTGTATQIMYSSMAFNLNIDIPNNGQATVIDFPVTLPTLLSAAGAGNDDEIFFWAMVGHTHKYGADFDMYVTPSPFLDTETYQQYDAGCANGIPGCSVETFDYAHLPFRFFDNFLPMTNGDFLITRTTWINDGPEDVIFGVTSDDEMQLYTTYFLKDTTGLELGNPTTISEPIDETKNRFLVYPNPSSEELYFGLMDSDFNAVDIEVYDSKGSQKLQQAFNPRKSTVGVNVSSWTPGIYFYRAIDQETGNLIQDGQIAVE